MGKFIKVVLGVLLAIIVLIGFMVIRTVISADNKSVAHTDVTPPDVTPQLIDVDADALAQNLAKAIQFKTVTMQNHEDTDWPVFLELQTWLAQTYPNFHNAVQSQQIKTYAQLHIWQGSDPSLAPIVFLAHQDVVPASEEENSGWDYPPFDGIIADGFIYGRGAVDDKGSLISILEAADRLAASGFTPKRTLMFGFGHDEEVKGTGAQAIAELLKTRGIKPYAVIDEGGAIISGLPGTQSPVAMIGVAEKGYLTLILKAKATGGHSSAPPSYTAIGALSKAIVAIENAPFESGLDIVSTKMLKAMMVDQSFGKRLAISNLWWFKPLVEDSLRSTPSSNAILGTTIAPTIIDAGFKENALPRDATAYVNFRIHNRDSIASVTAHVRKAINDPNIEITMSDNIGSEPSPISQIDAGPYLWLKDVISQSFPNTIIAPNTVIGGTDSRYFSIVTSDIYRFAPYAIDVSDLSRFHGLNERISVEAYAKAVQVYYLMLEKAGE
ncbi:MAG: hypothetical protein COA43_12835 [Robiginitomaculum sp.]|nr:MAG: hypothetical protein COA43_12835 [Robiginitomaculum sp.]